MSWTDERQKKLRELWNKGHTANQISNMLGETTRNAVIGKAHRMNLPARAQSKNSSSKLQDKEVKAKLLNLENFLEKLSLNH